MSYLHPDVSEDEVLAAIEDVVQALQGRFRGVAYLSDDDVGQELRVLALEILPKFQRECGPLKGFLYRSLRNRWLNKLRQFQGRPEVNCTVCRDARLGRGPGHPEGECPVRTAYRRRNKVKASIGRPRGIDFIADESEPRLKSNSVAEAEAEAAEILQLLDERLDPDDRRTMLQLRDGVLVPKAKREAFQLRVLALFAEVGLAPEDFGLFEKAADVMPIDDRGCDEQEFDPAA